MQEMEFAHTLRQSKVNIKICQVTFLSFYKFNQILYDNKSIMVILCSILMIFFFNIYTRHNPLQCLVLSMSILISKVSFLLQSFISCKKNVKTFNLFTIWTIFFSAVSPGQPSSISDDAEAFSLVGSGQDAANLINQKEIHWGVSKVKN